MSVERNIVKLKCGSTHGTALLIDKDHAVTVRHCVTDACQKKDSEFEFYILVNEKKIAVSLEERDYKSDEDFLVRLRLAEHVGNLEEIRFAGYKMAPFQEFHMFGYSGLYEGGNWIQLKYTGPEKTQTDRICDLRFAAVDSKDKTFEGFSGSPVFDKDHTLVAGMISQELRSDQEAIYLEGISIRSQKNFWKACGIPVEKEEDHPIFSSHKRKPVCYQTGRKNKLFYGRVQSIDKIISKLATDRLVFLTGAGGMGKSQIAREIVFQKQDSYELIMWFSAGTKIELLNAFNTAAKTYKLVDKGSNDFKFIVSVLSAFIDGFSSSLIVYDGVDDVPVNFLNEICFFERSDIIVTTQNSNIDADEFSVVFVDTFNRKDAESFLMTYAAHRKRTKEDGKTVSELCALLEYYPLALEYARAYVNKTQSSFAEYMQIYRKNKYDILDTPVTKYEKTAYTAWKLSYDKAVQDSMDARNILNMVSFLDTHDIPLQEIFVSMKQYSSYDLDKAIEKIKNYSLFSFNEHMVNIHGITQGFIRLQMEKSGEYQKYYEKTLQIFSGLIPSRITNASDKILVAKTINHAIKLIMYDYTTNNEDHLAFASNISSKLYITGSYMQTIELIQELFRKYRSLEQSMYMLQMVTFLSQAYHYAGDDPGSLEILEKYSSIVSSSNELTDIQKRKLLSRYKNVKGIVQKEQKNYKACLKTFSDALEILGSVYPETDYEVKCNILMNIGITYKHLHKCGEALRYYKQALACSNEDRHLLLRIYGNMAVAYKEINETEKAIQYYEQCLTFTQELGDRRNECICLENLGEYFMDSQQYKIAESYLRKSLEIAHNINYVSGIMNASYKLGRTLSLQQNGEDARKYFELSLEKSYTINDKEFIQRSTDALSGLSIQNLTKG